VTWQPTSEITLRGDVSWNIGERKKATPKTFQKQINYFHFSQQKKKKTVLEEKKTCAYVCVCVCVEELGHTFMAL
jgi:hypothetical protein